MLAAGLAEVRMVMMLGGAEARPTTLHRALLQALEAMADGSAPPPTQPHTLATTTPHARAHSHQ